MRVFIICVIVCVFLLASAICSNVRYSFSIISTQVPFYYKKALKNAKDEPFHIITTYNVNPNDTNIISTSIYGDAAKYYDGLNALIDNVKMYYPKWRLRVYCHDKAPYEYAMKLINDSEIQTYIVHDDMIESGNSAGAFWRFMPLSDKGINFISVDADDPMPQFTPTDLDNWMKSDKEAIRGFLSKQVTFGKPHICAKLFGCKSSLKIPPHVITHYPLRARFCSDELFLTKVLYPLVKDKEFLVFNNTWNKLVYTLAPSRNRLY